APCRHGGVRRSDRHQTDGRGPCGIGPRSRILLDHGASSARRYRLAVVRPPALPAGDADGTCQATGRGARARRGGGHDRRSLPGGGRPAAGAHRGRSGPRARLVHARPRPVLRRPAEPPGVRALDRRRRGRVLVGRSREAGRRGTAGSHRALRLGRRLPRPPQGADAVPPPGHRGPGRASGRGPASRRHGADRGPRGGRPRRAGLVRQERVHHRARARVLGAPRRTVARSGVGGGCAASTELRALPDLPRPLPDRRHRRTVHRRDAPLPLLPDDRAAGRDPGRAPSAPWRLGLRLRRLPGRLPVHPSRPARPGPRFSSPLARERVPVAPPAADDHGGRVPGHLPGHPRAAGEAAGAGPQRRRRARQRRLRGGRSGPCRRADRTRRAAGPRACGMGARAPRWRQRAQDPRQPAPRRTGGDGPGRNRPGPDRAFV
ncbi:MAG: Epoxyqueuosine reductase, partial [uncultured Thermomicrobiales bacterium]